jgi:hypothetical protein
MASNGCRSNGPDPSNPPSVRTHLGDVLGDQAYESLARKGETMTTAAMATCAYDSNRPGPSSTERGLEVDETYERLKTSYRRCHGDTTDIADQR